MKKLVLISLFPLFSLSQNNKEPIPITPKNMKIGDCYEMLFNYDKKIEWNKLDCDSIPGMKLPIGMKCIYRIGYKEIKEYQNKLINLGYDLSLNGVFDKKNCRSSP